LVQHQDVDARDKRGHDALERDELWLDRHPDLVESGCALDSLNCRMSFSENRLPPVGSKPEGKLFRDML